MSCKGKNINCITSYDELKALSSNNFILQKVFCRRALDDLKLVSYEAMFFNQLCKF